MKRSEVFEYIVDIPMQINIQWEENKVVVLLPAYQLPLGMLVESDNIENAIQALRQKVNAYWRGTQEKQQ